MVMQVAVIISPLIVAILVLAALIMFVAFALFAFWMTKILKATRKLANLDEKIQQEIFRNFPKVSTEVNQEIEIELERKRPIKFFG